MHDMTAEEFERLVVTRQHDRELHLAKVVPKVLGEAQ
jgi:hypothetical protein